MAQQKNEVAIIEKKVSPLVAEAEAHVIKDEKSMEKAVVMLSQMNKYGDNIKEEKEKITKPALAILAAERKRWKPLEDMYERGISILRKSMGAYQTEKVRIAEAEAKKVADRVGEGKGKLKPETAIRKIEEIDTPQKEVATAEGLVQFRDTKMFEVMDFKKLPDDYKEVNETAIRAAMKEGKPVPGVRFYTEQVPVNYR